MSNEERHILDRIADFNKFGSKLGLERMNALLANLGNPQEGLKVIHVAGTNGKGSVCKFIYEILQAAGYKCGLYISPFIERFNERIQFDGRYITDEELELSGSRAIAAAEKMVADGYESPTEFEVVTAVAIDYYASQNPDYVILEVGLGGRGDSTNVTDHPLISIITSISYDHMDRLGNSLEAIAYDKAGIIKEGIPCVMNVDYEEAKKVIAREAYEKHSALTDLSDSKIMHLSISKDGTQFSARIKDKDYECVNLKPIGEHQAQNAVTALAALDILKRRGEIEKVDSVAIAKGFAQPGQPGRFEVFTSAKNENKYIILDGAHNEDGIESLVNTMDMAFYGKKILMGMGILADKEVDKMLAMVTTMSDQFLTMTVGNPRTMTAEELRDRIKALGKEATSCVNVEEAVKAAEKKLLEEDYDVCLFAGSLYLISEIRKELRNGFVKEEF